MGLGFGSDVPIRVKTTPPAAAEAVFTPRAIAIHDRLRAFREAPGSEDEAEIRWGAAGFEQIEGGGGPQDDNFSVRIVDPDEPDQPPEKQVLEFKEIGKRVTEDVRVENPNDSEQFVIVQTILEITFEGPDGNCRKFILEPPVK